MRISVASTEPVRVPITLDESSSDPTSTAVWMAFLTSGTPDDPDWVTASWETVERAGHVAYRASCLIGPDGLAQPAAGTYSVWVFIEASPELPVVKAKDVLVVY